MPFLSQCGLTLWSGSAVCCCTRVTTRSAAAAATASSRPGPVERAGAVLGRRAGRGRPRARLAGLATACCAASQVPTRDLKQQQRDENSTSWHLLCHVPFACISRAVRARSASDQIRRQCDVAVETEGLLPHSFGRPDPPRPAPSAASPRPPRPLGPPTPHCTLCPAAPRAPRLREAARDQRRQRAGAEAWCLHRCLDAGW